MLLLHAPCAGTRGHGGGGNSERVSNSKSGHEDKRGLMRVRGWERERVSTSMKAKAREVEKE